MTVAVVLFTVALAAANGGNDVSKGVATLAGSGATRYRTAVAWGAATTLAGALASMWVGHHMLALFSSGIVDAAPTHGFALAVLVGSAAWVALATALRLPVSTTHAIVGALLGAGLLLDAGAVRWGALGSKVAVPLVASAVAAYLFSALAGVVARRAARPRGEPAGSIRDDALYAGLPVTAFRRGLGTLASAHWVSAGAVGAARGLNDTPKLAAVAGFALVPAGVSVDGSVVLVAGAMCAGALVAGIPVARRLGEDVVRLVHAEGLRANATTAVLVGLGAAYGLPMSTTHVSTGAIAGVSGTQVRRLNTRALRDFVLAWTATPVVAGVVAAGAFSLLR